MAQPGIYATIKQEGKKWRVEHTHVQWALNLEANLHRILNDTEAGWDISEVLETLETIIREAAHISEIAIDGPGDDIVPEGVPARLFASPVRTTTCGLSARSSLPPGKKNGHLADCSTLGRRRKSSSRLTRMWRMAFHSYGTWTRTYSRGSCQLSLRNTLSTLHAYGLTTLRTTVSLRALR